MTLDPHLTCCDGFRRLLTTAGDRGFGVVAFRDGEWREFQLQARSMTESQARRWQDALGDEALARRLRPLFADDHAPLVPVALAMNLTLSFCPYCGSDLRKRIKRNLTAFDVLAEDHRRFSLDRPNA